MSLFHSVLSIPRVYRVFWYLVGGPRYLKAFSEEYVKPKPGYRLLDIGCGPGDAVSYFPEVKYVGFDISPQYVEAARKRFPRAMFVCTPVAQFAPEKEQFDIVLALGILHHLDDGEAQQLFNIAHDALKPGGKLVTLDGVFTNDQSFMARYLINCDRGEFVRDQDGYRKIAAHVFTHVKSVVRHDLLRIPYSHVIMQCTR